MGPPEGMDCKKVVETLARLPPNTPESPEDLACKAAVAKEDLLPGSEIIQICLSFGVIIQYFYTAIQGMCHLYKDDVRNALTCCNFSWFAGIVEVQDRLSGRYAHEEDLPC